MDARHTLTDVVERARAGDQCAWDELIDRFTGLLWGVARAHRLDATSAADVTQATWLRLLENLDRIHEPEALPGWLLTTCRREALAVLRRHGREPLVRDPDPPEQAALDTELDLHLLEDERDAVLWRSFRRLGERCQQLLRILMSPECPPYAVVAQELGMPIGSLGPTRGRCLTTLRRLLGDSGYDFDTATTGGPR